MAVDDSRIGQDEYQLGFNVRNRFGDLRPIKRPLSITTGFTAGVPLQGVYSVGDFIILAQGGDAKFKHRLADTWTTLWDASESPTLRLHPSNDVYFQAVPGSTMNIHREIVDNDSVDGEINHNSAKTAWVETIAGIVVQDGEHIPNLIVFGSTTAGKDFTVRKCTTYENWDVDTREYVPIGKQMMFFGGKLYLVAKGSDGRFTKIYHSVSGRPLDFVIPVDEDGAKIADIVEPADFVSFSPSYDEITCISPLNTDAFLVGTNTTTYAITPILAPIESLPFGEPVFAKKYLFGASVVNQFSFIDIMGDFAFIDAEGLRSFNAVMQLRNEGRNSAFSLSVAKLFEGIVQDNTLSAAISFDNYAFFAVQTIYGNVVVVYDIITKKFVSLDQYQLGDAEAVEVGGTGGFDSSGLTTEGFGTIKQFTKIDTDTTHELYAITTTGEFLQFFAGAKYAPASITTRAWSSGDPRVEQKPIDFRALFSSVDAWESDSLTLNGGPYSPDGTGTGPGGAVYTVGTEAQAITVLAIPYALSTDDAIYFAGTSTATGGLFHLTADAAKGATSLTGTLDSSGTISSGLSGWVRFTGAGTAKVSLYTNDMFSTTPGIVAKTIAAPIIPGIKYTDLYPLNWSGDNSVQNLLFNFQQGRHGWKVGYVIGWDNSAYLSIIQTDTKDMTPKNPLMTQAYGS